LKIKVGRWLSYDDDNDNDHLHDDDHDHDDDDDAMSWHGGLWCSRCLSTSLEVA
jgi:hypothetical protein